MAAQVSIMSDNGRDANGNLQWFDAHLDLAMLAMLGRNMRGPAASAGGPDLPASITLTELARGGVNRTLATIFTETGGSDRRIGYPHGDGQAAFVAGCKQLQVYRQWQVEGAMAVGSGASGLRAGLLIEGADVIAQPEDLAWWASYGVVAVGMAWWHASRYAGGNGTPRDDARAGLSALGVRLGQEIDRLGLVHDASHLADRAFDELYEKAGGMVVASHSNCRGLMGDAANQRHVTDAQIRAICARGGVVGLNLYSRFLDRSCETGGRTTVERALDHVEHVCMLAGSHEHVGLGTDADGGFSAARLPQGIDGPADYARLAEGLAARGWSDEQIGGFVRGNWLRIFPMLS